MIWIEQNDRVLNHEQWHESKSKHLVWDDLIIYAKVGWERLIKYVMINTYSSKALFTSFDETWGARNVLCGRDQMKITWN
jgi:hypothetical protein